jgi:hypothetical protein
MPTREGRITTTIAVITVIALAGPLLYERVKALHEESAVRTTALAPARLQERAHRLHAEAVHLYADP